MGEAIRFDAAPGVRPEPDARRLVGTFEITAPIAFAPRLRARIEAADGRAWDSDSAGTCYLAWLPRGRYRFHATLPAEVPAGAVRFHLQACALEAMADVVVATMHGNGVAGPAPDGGEGAWSWQFESVAPTAPLGTLSWNKGHGDWFFRHFDHAATTVVTYLLKDSPLLRGRILDVGCGDGITDLSIALRTGCRELIGIDPFRGYERLPGIVASNGLPADLVPGSLRFLPEDANRLPFPDDSFDVVLSWGSVEHMAGGYLQALREVKRVLKPEGLFMVAPGLYYSTIGHHLDEFSDEPFFHLKKPREEIRRMVLERAPRYIDRSGEFAGNEQYWRWFNELNPITVTRFEQELRALEFQPWRVALRTVPLVEYTPEIEHYAIETLANTELYMSCVNRKRPRG